MIAIVLLGVLTLTWGANWPAMKLALSEVPLWTFRSICLVVGGLGLLVLARARGDALAIPPGDRRPLVAVTLFNITGWHLLSAYGLTLIGAGRASIIAYTMPLWAVTFERVAFGTPVTRARAAALALGLAGLAVLIGPDLARLRAAPAGALFMLGAAMSWAAGTVLVKRRAWAMSTSLLAGWQVLLGGVPIVLGALVLESPPALAAVSRAALLGVLYATFVGTIFCHWLWFTLVRLLPPAVASIGILGVPVVGVLSSALLLSEAAGIREIGALALILPAVAVVLVGPGLVTAQRARAGVTVPAGSE